MTTLLSETFTGTNGANWNSTNWDYKYFQFGGIGDIQSNKGRLVTGAIGSGNDYGTYRSAASFSDFRATFDYTVSGSSTSGSYLAFGFRASSTWIAGQMIADNCYWVEMTRGASATFTLKRRTSSGIVSLGILTTSYTAGDVVHVKVIANGSSLKVRMWKNADTEPSTWTFSVVDANHTSGKFFFSVYGGTDTATETFTIDDFVVDDNVTELSNSPAAGSPLGTGTAYAPSISAINGSTPTLMAETWTGSNGAAWPAQWTSTTAGTGTVADIQSNKGRMATGTAVYGKVGARNTTALSSDDYTLTVDIVIPTYTEWYFFVHVRGSSSFNNVYQLLSSYQFRFTSYLNAVVPELYQVDGSGVATLASAGALTGAPVAGDTLRIKIEVSGTTTTTLKQKAWIVGASEPSYTDLSAAATVAYTGDYIELSVQGGDNLVSEDFLWDNFTIGSADDGTADAQTATGVAVAGNPNPSVLGYVNAQLASGHGEGMFDGAGEMQTLTLEALDAVGANGEAFSVQKAHNAGSASGSGAANAATIGGSRNVPATAASGAGAANNATTALTGAALATTATSVGTANAATVSIVGVAATNVAAEPALAAGSATGIGYILDENGDVIRDENGEGIGDGVGLTVRLSTSITASAGSGASNTPTRAVAPSVVAATSTGTAPQPAVNTSGGTTTTNVNAAVASSVGAANVLTATVALESGAGLGAGSAELPIVTAPVVAGEAVGVGTAPDATIDNAPPTAEGSGTAFDAQINLNAFNFASVAAIPISASAADAIVDIAVNAVLADSDGNADVPSIGSRDEPGQLITIRDRGHTVTLKER